MSAAALAEAFVALRVDASNLDQDIERGTQASIDKALPDMEKHGERVGERIGKGWATASRRDSTASTAPPEGRAVPRGHG